MGFTNMNLDWQASNHIIGDTLLQLYHLNYTHQFKENCKTFTFNGLEWEKAIQNEAIK